MIKLKKRVLWLFAAAMSLSVSAFDSMDVFADTELKEKEFLYETDRVMDGIYGEETLYFQIPEYWETEHISGNMFVRLSPMILDTPASLTFELNEIPVQSVNLDYADGPEQKFEISLPTEQIHEGYNELTVSGFARIYDEEGCLDEFSGANWVILDANSGISVQYRLKEPADNIAEYPYPLLSMENDTGAGTAVVVPDEVSGEELNAAAWVRAGLAKKTGEADQIQTLYYSDYEKQPMPAVIISLYEKLPDEWKEIIAARGVSESDLEQNAMIAVQRTDGGIYQVWITSSNPACLAEAAQFLMDENRISQEQGSMALVALDSAEKLKEGVRRIPLEFKLSDWFGNPRGIMMHGAFRQEKTIYPPTGVSYVLSPEDSIDLKFRYSENLDFRRSLVTVSVNGEQIGSKKLEKEMAGNDELVLSIPEDLAGERLKSIVVSFDLEIEELYCTVRMDEMPWAFLSADSGISLKGLQNGTPSFETMPWPFVKKGLADEMCFVLPESPKPEELELFGQLASLYGQSMGVYGDLNVVCGADDSGLQNKNVILIGTFENQPVLHRLDASLPFAVNWEKGAFDGNEMFAFSDTYARTTAVMQLVPSPFGGTRTWLVVTAPNQENLNTLADWLTKQKNRENLSGDTVLVDSDLQMRSFTFQNNKKGAIDELTLRQRLEENKEPAMFSLVSVAAMLLFLLAAVLILIRARAVGKKGE